MRIDKREGKYKEFNRAAGTSSEEKAGGGRSARRPCIGAMQLCVGSARTGWGRIALPSGHNLAPATIA
jgi:hypothetical protein